MTVHILEEFYYLKKVTEDLVWQGKTETTMIRCRLRKPAAWEARRYPRSADPSSTKRLAAKVARIVAAATLEETPAGAVTAGEAKVTTPATLPTTATKPERPAAKADLIRVEVTDKFSKRALKGSFLFGMTQLDA
jgi:hypothetical protein